MNQRVLTDHITRVGLNSEIAENGQEGIDKVQKRIDTGQKPFDLIFMDIHMPVMDGIKATPKIIRLGTGTPVVAMTANVMIESREHYKTLGMSDYVGKPFTSQELWRCLLKYLKPVGFAESGKAEENSDSILQKQLKTDFAKSNQAKFDEIAGALAAGDVILAHRLAHTLKSNTALIGRPNLQKVAADVEASLKDGENRTTAEQMTLLQSELCAALDELTPFLDETTEDQMADEYDAEEARALLDKLEPLLKSGNPDSLGLIDGLRSIPGSKELIEKIEDF
jgi:CheY-like chemotaxis protein